MIIIHNTFKGATGPKMVLLSLDSNCKCHYDKSAKVELPSIRHLAILFSMEFKAAVSARKSRPRQYFPSHDQTDLGCLKFVSQSRVEYLQTILRAESHFRYLKRSELSFILFSKPSC